MVARRTASVCPTRLAGVLRSVDGLLRPAVTGRRSSHPLDRGLRVIPRTRTPRRDAWCCLVNLCRELTAHSTVNAWLRRTNSPTTERPGRQGEGAASPSMRTPRPLQTGIECHHGRSPSQPPARRRDNLSPDAGVRRSLRRGLYRIQAFGQLSNRDWNCERPARAWQGA